MEILEDSTNEIHTNEIRIRRGSPVLKYIKVAKDHVSGCCISGSLHKVWTVNDVLSRPIPLELRRTLLLS